MNDCRIQVSNDCDQLDNEDWLFDVQLTQSDSGLPVNLTGSRVFIQFVSTYGRTKVAFCDSGLADGTLTIIDPTAGKIRILSRPVARAWRCPLAGPGRISLPQTVEGDLIRVLMGTVEGLATLRFVVRAGTTQDEANGPGEPLPNPELPNLADLYEEART